MSPFPVERFTAEAEAFVQARARRQVRYELGEWPDLDLDTLYEQDFPSLTSAELYGDLYDAPIEDPGHKNSLIALACCALLEGRTVLRAERAASFATRTTVTFEGQELTWRLAPAHWQQIPEAPRRHDLQTAWRTAFREHAEPLLERWVEELRTTSLLLEAPDWLAFKDGLLGFGVQDGRLATAANTLLGMSADVYAHVLGVYLGQLNLPIDDVWTSDVDWAFRARQFHLLFPSHKAIPTMVRAFRDVSIELPDQRTSGLHLHLGENAAQVPEVHVLPVDVPREVHVLVPRVGGHQDYLALLSGLGGAQHALHTDASLPFAERWLGDPSTTRAYGLIFERLGRDPLWLSERLEIEALQDVRVVSHLAWLYRVRRAAALTLYEPYLWRDEGTGAAGGLAGHYEQLMGETLHVRHFPEEHLLPVFGAPWSTLAPAVELRAELLAAHLRAYLRKEFDDEWWRNGRAGRFLIEELWRPGRRYTADELLGHLGYEGFDPALLWAEFADVLAGV